MVQNLDGSEMAKRRLEVILETIAGQLAVGEACRQLGISEPRFYQLRTAVLEAGLACLEPRLLGRPPQLESAEAAQIVELTEQLKEAQWEQRAAEVRAQVAAALPHLHTRVDESVKKTTQRRQRTQALRNKRSQRRRKPR